MTVEELMNAIKHVYSRTMPGPLRERAWRVILEHVARDLHSYLRSNPTASRIDYTFHVVVDSDGHTAYNGRTLEAANNAFLRLLTGSEPEQTLQVSIHVYRRGERGRVIVDVSSTRNSEGLTSRGSGSNWGRDGHHVEGGGRAALRPGSDLSRMSSLSGTGGTRPAGASGSPASGRPRIASAGSGRGVARTRQATAQMPEQSPATPR